MNKVIAGAVAVSLMAPAFAFAQTSTTSPQAQAILTQIQALQTQIAALQEQYKLLASQQNAAFKELVTTLKEGSAGDQVAILQALLALDPSIYPEGKVTGFFGRLTAEAVKRYQRKHGIESLGFVGPKTMKKLNEMLRDQDEDDNDDEDNDRGGKGQEKVRICHKGTTITVAMPSVFAHLKHGDARGACDGSGTGTTTPPVTDTVKPILSSIISSVTGSTTASVSWNTNESANGKVYLSTSSPAYGSSWFVSNAALTTTHLFSLSGLSASTTYYYAVESKDAANNVSTSSTSSFVTN